MIWQGPNMQMTMRYIVGKPEIDSSTLRIFGVYDEDYPKVATDEFIDDLDGGFIEAFEKAERDGVNVIRCTQDCLDCLNIATHTMRGWVNKDTKLPCDEHGIHLSQDGEHRAFELIPGGKQ